MTEQILVYLAKHGPSAIMDIAEHLGVARTTARTHLLRMQRRDQVELTYMRSPVAGHYRNGRWIDDHVHERPAWRLKST